MLDIPNKNYVMSEAPGQFHVLPLPETGASDEVFFGNTEWLKQNEKTVQILLEETLTVWRKIEEDPSYVMKERERLGLAPDLPPEQEKEILPYYKQAAEEGLFTQDCGGREAARGGPRVLPYRRPDPGRSRRRWRSRTSGTSSHSRKRCRTCEGSGS